MSEIQHRDARKLLRIIQKRTVVRNAPLNYGEAAELLGRPAANNRRPVAQICDLLDAAAGLAGVPLLALVMVRDKSGEINPKAWRGNPADEVYREAIIETSLRHSFVRADFDAIEAALDKLVGKGNRAAWKYVRRTVPDLVLFLHIASVHRQGHDAIDDIGADAPPRRTVEVAAYVRDPRIREAVKKRANGRCELCGELGFAMPDGEHYIECHHVIALANDGADRLSNVIGLCASHHREAHFGSRGAELEQEMMHKLAVLTGSS